MTMNAEIDNQKFIWLSGKEMPAYFTSNNEEVSISTVNAAQAFAAHKTEKSAV